ncbi:MAG: hypothetical protein ACTSVP_03465 [Candidatus Heimdallarchaeota archaeon]
MIDPRWVDSGSHVFPRWLGTISGTIPIVGKYIKRFYLKIMKEKDFSLER